MEKTGAICYNGHYGGLCLSRIRYKTEIAGQLYGAGEYVNITKKKEAKSCIITMFWI